jgi:hypothetical protein
VLVSIIEGPVWPLVLIISQALSEAKHLLWIILQKSPLQAKSPEANLSG